MSAWVVALLAVILAALALRLYGIDWDDGADLHPDELFIAKIVLIDRIRFDWPPDLHRLVDPARSGLNPRSVDPATGQFREFAYGALPLWVTDAAAWALSRVTGADWNAMDRAYLVGRAISALLGALTVAAVAALGVAIAGRSVGLLAAIFAALAPMSIQLAHFFTTDSWLTFFVAACLVACIKAADLGHIKFFALAGAFFGLAMATKGSVFALAIPIVVAIAVDALRPGSTSTPPVRRHATIRALAAASTAMVAFFAFEPFALVRPDIYLQSLKTQADIASGTFDVPFTRVYAGTVPLAYQFEQFVRWGYGPVAGGLAVAGAVLIAAAAWRRRSAPALILTGWLSTYGGVIVLSDSKFLRYLEPLSPIFAVAAALALVSLTQWFTSRATAVPSWAVPALALALTSAWTGALLTVYAHENPRITASRWIYAEVPPGSVLTAEYWDDALPRALAYTLSPTGFGFGAITLDLYRDLPPEAASGAIYDAITDADFIIQSSDRVEAAIRAAPWRYPVQRRYFDQLERGTLGFSQIAEFARPPSIGQYVIDDRDADESFVNYDHPRVSVYERMRALPRATYDMALAWALQRPWYPTREPPEPTLLLDGPVGQNPTVADGRWSAALTSSTAGALAAWVVLLGCLLIAGRGLARLLMPSFPDQGWGLARVLALAVAAYAVWIGASLEILRFRAVWVVAALVGTALAGHWLATRFRPPTAERLADLNNRAWIHAEAAFWLVFLLFLVFRLANPDGWHPFWGGEKPMEFAQINAIERSAYFPPYDPWYADGYVNYYYYGFYLAAFLFKATGIPAEVGFNLALPTMMGLLASGSFSVAAALTRGSIRSPHLSLVGGWAGVVLVCLAGNLTAIRRLIEAETARFDPFLYWTWSGSRAIDNVITEFPYFSGLYADLHSHVIALPLTVAAVGVCLALAAEREAIWTNPAPLIRLCILALLIGSLSATNAWDVPVYAVLAVSSLLITAARITPSRRRVTSFFAGSFLVFGGAWLLFLPFHVHFVALFGRVALVRDPSDLAQFLSHLGGLVTICALGLTVLLITQSRSPVTSALWPWVAVAAGSIGLVLLMLSTGHLETVIGGLLVSAALAGPPLAAAWLLAGSEPTWKSRLGKSAVLIAAFIAVLSVASDRAVFGVMLALGAAAGVGWFQLARETQRFVCLLLAAGFFVAAGVELVVVADDLIGTAAYRMNTVFKFYNQVWMLLSLAGAGLIALMVHWSTQSPRGRAAGSISSRPITLSRVGIAVSAILLIGAMSYPVLATAPRLEQRFTPGTRSGSLNALTWMEDGVVPVIGDPEITEIPFSGDLAAIRWFFANVRGSPVIAEASIGPYRCNGSRISTATGLPTIVGWERHEQQQRYAETLPGRVEDVRRLYTSSDAGEKADILRRYNVEYVVVGALERAYPIANNECTPSGSQAGISAFDAMLGDTLEIAFVSGETVIYRVLPIDAS